MWICVQLLWIYTQLILVEDNFLQYIYNFAVRSTTFSFIYLTSNKICTTCLSNKPLIDLFTQLLTCRHQGCFAIYDVLFTCLTYGSFYNSPTKYTTWHCLSTTSSMKYRTSSTFSSYLLSISINRHDRLVSPNPNILCATYRKRKWRLRRNWKELFSLSHLCCVKWNAII